MVRLVDQWLNHIFEGEKGKVKKNFFSLSLQALAYYHPKYTGIDAKNSISWHGPNYFQTTCSGPANLAGPTIKVNGLNLGEL